MNETPANAPRCPFCNSIFQGDQDLAAGAQVNCQRCAESFTLNAPVVGRSLDRASANSATGLDERQRKRRIRRTLGVVLATMASLAGLAIVFINQTQPFRRQKDLPPGSDAGELVGLVAEGADCIIRLEGSWLAKNRIDSLTLGTPFAFFADALSQIPAKLGFAKIDELMVGIPEGAPFSSRFAAGLKAPWNPAMIDAQFSPTKVSSEVYRVKVQGWPLSLDLKQVQPERVLAMMAKSTGESSVEKRGASAAPMAGPLKEMLGRVARESPFWLVAKKAVVPKLENEQKKALPESKNQNALFRLLEADWTVIGVWVEMPVDDDQKVGGGLRSEMVLRMELVFDGEAAAQKWENARLAEKAPGWKSIREKKTVSVQWKGFLESSWK